MDRDSAERTRREVVRVWKRGNVTSEDEKLTKKTCTIIFIIWKYLLPEVQFADKQIEQVKVAAVEQQVDEAQHGCGTHHCACQVSEPHHGLDDSHRDQVKAWEGGDHWVPLHNDQHHVKEALHQFHMRILVLVSATQLVKIDVTCLLLLWRSFAKSEKLTLSMSCWCHQSYLSLSLEITNLWQQVLSGREGVNKDTTKLHHGKWRIQFDPYWELNVCMSRPLLPHFNYSFFF